MLLEIALTSSDSDLVVIESTTEVQWVVPLNRLSELSCIELLETSPQPARLARQDLSGDSLCCNPQLVELAGHAADVSRHEDVRSEGARTRRLQPSGLTERRVGGVSYRARRTSRSRLSAIARWRESLPGGRYRLGVTAGVIRQSSYQRR